MLYGMNTLNVSNMSRFNPRTAILLIGAFIVAVFLLVLAFQEEVTERVMFFVGEYHYPAVFALALFVEMVSQPLGPEVPILAGKLVGLGVKTTVVIVAGASFIAGNLNYRLGSLFYRRVCSDKRCDRYVEAYMMRGKYALAFAALGPIPYVPFCWFSGAFGLPYREYLVYGIIPRIIRVIIASYVITIL